MDKVVYQPVSHDHEAFLKKALKRKEFRKSSEGLEEEYRLAREMLTARSRLGLTQEEVAGLMGTTKSAVSRLEATGKHTPSLATLKKYAQAVGCQLEIKLIPNTRPAKRPQWYGQKTGDGINSSKEISWTTGFFFNHQFPGIGSADRYAGGTDPLPRRNSRSPKCHQWSFAPACPSQKPGSGCYRPPRLHVPC